VKNGDNMEIITLLTLVVGFSLPNQENTVVMPFEKLKDSPWKPLHWADRPFIFISYGGDWSKSFQRVAHECKVQRLLTPTWEDPTFVHPIESSATEWGWSIIPEGKNKRECYDWTKKLYLDRITKYAHSNAPMEKEKLFYSVTGHSWYSVYGAQWGCDMIGLETGENIIAMQGEIAFLRGSARQNRKPFYVQPSQWYGGTVPIFEEGEDEYTPHELDKAKILDGISKGGIAIPNGGHSSSLLSRMWYVAWLSGAAVVCPEACQDIFFAGKPAEKLNQPEDKRIPLSPIGKKAQEFMRMVDNHNDVGIPYTPYAIMLDEFCGFNGFPLTQPRSWNVLNPSLGDREISLFFDTIFPKSMYLDFIPGVDVEQEDRRLVSSPYGDSFDTLLSNASQDIINSYPIIICLGDHEFLPDTVDKLISYVRSGGKLFLTYSHAEQLGDQFKDLQSAGYVEFFGLDKEHTPEDIDITRWYTPAHWGADDATLKARKKGVELLPYEVYFKNSVAQLMDKLSRIYLPIDVTGDIEYIVNQTDKGWIIGLINNDGVTKGNMTPVKLDLSKKKTVIVRLKRGDVISAREWCINEVLKIKENGVIVEVPSGEVRIVEFQTQVSSK
jgi:hypothetical protein